MVDRAGAGPWATLQRGRGLVRDRPDHLQIAPGVGLPGVVLAHPLQAGDGALLPALPVEQDDLQVPGDGLGIQGIDQQAVVAVADDVPRPAVLGGDDGQAAGGRLDQGQAEGFGQGRIDEHPAGSRRQAVDQGHVVGRMVLGIGDPAVEVVAVDQQQQLGPDLFGPRIQVPDVIPVAGHHQQIGQFLQFRVLTVGGNQRGDVLAGVRARQGQDHGLLGLAQKARDLAGDGTLPLLALGGVEAGQVGAGGDDPHLLGLVEVVELVLFLDLLRGAGDDPLGAGQGQLLGLDATRHVVAGLDLGRVQPRGQQAPALDAAQGVAGVHQGDAQQVGQAAAHVAGVRVVAVQEVRQAGPGREASRCSCRRKVQHGPTGPPWPDSRQARRQCARCAPAPPGPRSAGRNPRSPRGHPPTGSTGRPAPPPAARPAPAPPLPHTWSGHRYRHRAPIPGARLESGRGC